MRQKQQTQTSLLDEFEFWFPAKHFTSDKNLSQISDVLDQVPQVLEMISEDLNITSSENTGRPGITSEQILRTALIKMLKGYSYRELVQRIADSIDYRRFTRFYMSEIPHFTAVEKLLKRIKPETTGKINEILVGYSNSVTGKNGRRLETGKSLRIDCAVTPTDITYPVDAKLLNDSVRVLTSILVFCRNDLGIKDFSFADRTRRAKKRAYQIVMLKGPQAQKKRRKLYRDLLKVTAEVIAGAEEALISARKAADQYPEDGDLAGVISGLEHFIPLAKKAVDQCRRRTQNGEKVPAEDKIVSIFEEHTDIICRGKSGSKTEFGHKLLFCTGKSGLITQYEVFRGNPGDNTMLPDILKEHAKLFGYAPEKLAGDRRFFSRDNEELANNQGVKLVSIPKPGRLNAARKTWQEARWFKKLQRFRAGIEGNISNLIRNYGLKKCLWKGWVSFQSYVGLAVFAYNLWKIAQLAA